MFDAIKIKNQIVQWLKAWFDENGKDCNAVIGISGGKDSSVVAALCVEALGKDRVIGIMMPNGYQSDIGAAYTLCRHLGIKYHVVNIGSVVTTVKECIDFPLSEQSNINLPARIRMATLYAVSQSVNGRVANTCNLSEDWIGYSTRYGDSVGDFSPLSLFTSDEVIEIGRACGLPSELVEKVPTDGLCGKTDEDNFGFTYHTLNKYIRTGECDNEDIKQIIDQKHKNNLFKTQPMPVFWYTPESE